MNTREIIVDEITRALEAETLLPAEFTLSIPWGEFISSDLDGTPIRVGLHSVHVIPEGLEDPPIQGLDDPRLLECSH